MYALATYLSLVGAPTFCSPSGKASPLKGVSYNGWEEKGLTRQRGELQHKCDNPVAQAFEA